MYFVGGLCDGVVLRLVEWYNFLIEEWEFFFDLMENWKWCFGCIMDNKFFVIGG